MKKFFICILLIMSTVVTAQNLDSTSFDFWVGEWELHWVNKQGDSVQGSNRIEKILDGMVLQENFYDPSTNFKGKSWSTLNRKKGEWKQTWVDNYSGYLQFSGVKMGDTLAFVMEAEDVNGLMVIRRMIFYNIERDYFTWDWQRKEVGAKSWEQLWRIHYFRKS